ncbi:MAG: tRNA pseudouridine(55) synthase TruB [Armatimonadia bacterium]|nr:tRNA pseudouridine(55) synthase TruB [Armatimonadia bacterium]
MHDGLLLVDKPAGPTSHDIVARVRRAAGQRRVGHAGTLDPPATGLLIILLGAATRLQRYILGADKTYTFDLVLGRATDTLDMAGQTITEEPVGSVEASDLLRAAEGLLGEVRLVPPMVSAIHHEGRRLHEIARAGETVEREARPCRIDRLESVGHAAPDGDLLRVPMAIECSSGTYVRSVGEALGEALGVPACIDNLRRTAIDGWTEGQARSMEQIEADLVAALRPMAEAVAPLARVDLDTEEERAFLHGNPVEDVRGDEGERAAFGPSGFLGVGHLTDGWLRPRTVVARQGRADG